MFHSLRQIDALPSMPAAAAIPCVAARARAPPYFRLMLPPPDYMPYARFDATALLSPAADARAAPALVCRQIRRLAMSQLPFRALARSRHSAADGDAERCRALPYADARCPGFTR